MVKTASPTIEPLTIEAQQKQIEELADARDKVKNRSSKKGFSYGGRLCSVVGWLGYGGNLTWRKQEYFMEHILGVPISQGSLAKMQRWFQESLAPSYQQWLS